VRTGGRFTSTRELAAAAFDGDDAAGVVWRRSIRALAAALAGLINAFDPQMVVLGGGIAMAGDALFSPVRAHLDTMEWRVGAGRVALVPAQLGTAAGAFGAAWRARQKFINS
jgi:glucokinase